MTTTTERRFEFGPNWSRFAGDVSPHQIEAARRSLAAMLDEHDLRGRRLLDIGSGSGLFSLAATRLGAEHVHSFDYDEESVATTRAMKQRFAPHASWNIEQASVLDTDYMGGLGEFDVVYAWGVLHHTGAMWDALDNACRAVCVGGRLFVSIYNDQGAATRRWKLVKTLYNRLPHRLRGPYAVLVMLPSEARAFLAYLVRLRSREYLMHWRQGGQERGMSRWHDILDWVGGYPFEVAKPEEVFEFCRSRGFSLERLVTRGGGWACNEFVLRRES